MGLPDDNPSSFGDHYGFGGHAGLEGLASCWRELPLLVSHNLLINIRHQSHQIAAHPFHHLPMGLPDDNPSCWVGRISKLFARRRELLLLVQLCSLVYTDF
jgi:hypothetical protein